MLAPPSLARAPEPPVPVAAAVRHSRLLPLEGGRNFRDLGGYRTRDGRHVKWGLLFRSGVMSGLTAADFSYLSQLGIRTVCDLRDTRERHAEPVSWPSGGASPAVFADDYDMTEVMPRMDIKTMTPASARRLMASTYPRILTSFNGQFRRMFGELLAGRAPLAFNCSAGKDRTGIAAALLLIALDVPRETVIADYLLTNRYLNQAALMRNNNTMPPGFAGMPQPVLAAMGAADRSYIEAAMRVVDGHRGGAEGYFRDELGLSRADLFQLRRMYLQ
jgi:protein-tyrosine phosphatase